MRQGSTGKIFLRTLKVTQNLHVDLFGNINKMEIYNNMDNFDLRKYLAEAKKEIETFEKFAETRGEGAAKIASNAQEKGGLALLTWHHFKVKAPYYKKASEGKLDMEQAKKEFEETYKKISLDMSQIEFQREVGRLEVLGELLIKNK